MATPAKRITFGDFSMPRYQHRPPSIENIMEDAEHAEQECEEEEAPVIAIDDAPEEMQQITHSISPIK